MKKIFYYLPSIIFNVVETLIIFLIGRLLMLKYTEIILILLVFGLLRIRLGGALHYKSPIKCLIWSSLVIASLFITSKCGLLISLLMTIFCSYILTDKGNINDMFMWGGNKLNKDVFEWVKFNLDNPKLIKYENNLKEIDKKKYIIFEYRFRELKSYSQIAELMDIPTQRVSEELNIINHFIEFSVRLGVDE